MGVTCLQIHLRDCLLREGFGDPIDGLRRSRNRQGEQVANGHTGYCSNVSIATFAGVPSWAAR